MPSHLKIDAARRQLGTALALYLRDQDPFSVHVLASGGAELAEGFIEELGAKPLRDFALDTWPGVTARDYYEQKKRFVNPMKHYKDFRGRVRDDDEALTEFTDEHNDAILFDGWSNYSIAGHASPVEAQVYLAWFMALTPWKFPMDEEPAQRVRYALSREFPNLTVRSRQGQKRLLLRAIKRKADDTKFRRSAGVDQRPLVLPAAIAAVAVSASNQP